MSKSKITPIGQALLDVVNEWAIAKDSDYVQKPISYALYNVWRKWDEKESPERQKARTRGTNDTSEH